MINTYPKNAGVKLSEHFSSSEFDCRCTFPECSNTLIDSVLVQHLEKLRGLCGGAVKVINGYRCQAYQDSLSDRGYNTSKGISQHVRGRGSDIAREGLRGVELRDLASLAGFLAIGTGLHFIHVDTRDDKVRRWDYPY